MLRRKLVSLILILILFTNGCAKEVSLVANKGEYFTIYSNDNISVKISDRVRNQEYIYNTILNNLQKINRFSSIHKIEIDIAEKHIIPKIEGSIKCNSSFINTEEFKKEPIKKSYDIYDNWISEGLYAKIYDIEKPEVEFSTYYTNNDFSLFGAKFFEPFASKEEIENIQVASIDLVEHLIQKDRKEELLKNQVDISDIEEWAKDKNINLSYQRGIESLMNRMEINKIKPNIFLTINTKENINGFIIDIQTIDEQYDTSKKIKDFILMMDINIKSIKEGIKEDAPNFYNEYRDAIENVPKIHYYFDINANIDLAEMGQSRIALKNLSAQAHEYSHILIVDSFLNNSIVVNKPIRLDEGMANYLDVVYSDSSKLEIAGILHSVFDSKENEDKLSEKEKILIDKLYKIFRANNIEPNNINDIIEDKNEKIKVSTIATTVRTNLSKLEDSEVIQRGAVFLKVKKELTKNYGLWVRVIILTIMPIEVLQIIQYMNMD